MNTNDLLRLVLIGVLITHPESAQTRAYAKFGASGEAIGLFNLSKRTTECQTSRTFTGTAASLQVQIRKQTTDYSFVMRSGAVKARFTFALHKDEILLSDIESLLAKRHTILVRACGKGNQEWSVEEIALIQ